MFGYGRSPLDDILDPVKYDFAFLGWGFTKGISLKIGFTPILGSDRNMRLY